MTVAAPKVPFEPHLSADWFALLQRTALPKGAIAEPLESVLPVGNVCVLPLMRLPDTPWRLESMATFYSPIYGPIDGVVPDPDALTGKLRALRSASHDRPAVIDLSPLDPDTPFFRITLDALRRAGWLADRYFRFGNWHAHIASDSFDHFIAERPSRLRNTLQRSRRKIERLGDVSLTIHTRPDNTLDRAIADFVAVYNASWKRPEPFPDFIPGLCRLAAERGWLRLGIMRRADQAVAVQLWLIAGGRAQIVKLAHDPAWQHGSIGTVLTADLMRHAIEHDRVTEIDYLIGDDAYKRDWMPLRRERHGLIAFNPSTARGLAAALRHYSGRAIRHLRPVAT